MSAWSPLVTGPNCKLTRSWLSLSASGGLPARPRLGVGQVGKILPAEYVVVPVYRVGPVHDGQVQAGVLDRVPLDGFGHDRPLAGRVGCGALPPRTGSNWPRHQQAPGAKQVSLSGGATPGAFGILQAGDRDLYELADLLLDGQPTQQILDRSVTGTAGRLTSLGSERGSTSRIVDPLFRTETVRRP
jgi:hypothetical protein